MSRRPASFGPESLLETLSLRPCRGRYWVAFSGGADSTALLLALHGLRERLAPEIGALHVHHGVHTDADAWEAHCRNVCERLDMPLLVDHLQPGSDTGEGPEAELRRLRYAALAARLESGDVLLTGHHLEDQAETVLLNLLRGSGPGGLAGMPQWRALGLGRLCRPLLAWPRLTLRTFVAASGYGWIEDSGNRDLRFDRSFVRQEVMPRLRGRWPAVDAVLARSAAHNREADELLRKFAEHQLAERLVVGQVLELDKLPHDEPALLKLLIRNWLGREGTPALAGTRLEELVRQLAGARPDSSTSLAWEDWRLDLHGSELWLHRAGAPPDCPALPWGEAERLDLGAGLGSLALGVAPVDAGLQGLEVRSRHAGDTIQLHSHRHHTRVKEVLRQACVPPWLRQCVPVLTRADEILAVGDWAISRALAQHLTQSSARLIWRPTDPALSLVRQRAVAKGTKEG